MKIPKLALISLLVAAAPALAAETSITQQNQTFSQSNATVHVGDSLHFMNNDTVTHNITVKGGKDDDADDLGLQKPGAGVSHTFDEKGTYRIMCSIHPRMKMSVTVQ